MSNKKKQRGGKDPYKPLEGYLPVKEFAKTYGGKGYKTGVTPQRIWQLINAERNGGSSTPFEWQILDGNKLYCRNF